MAKAKKKNGKARTTVVSFLLDETGSMQSIKDDTIGGFNSYIDNLAKDAEGKIEFSFLKFDSKRIEKVCVGADIKDVAPLTNATYRPGAMTPLVDACMKTILATEDVVGERKDKPSVLCVFQTDGHENCSTEYRFSDLAEKIKEKEVDGWAFVFLGAGVDAYDIGVQQMGLDAATVASYDRGQSKGAFAAMSANTASYAATGLRSAATFSATQRSALGDTTMDKAAAGAVPAFTLNKAGTGNAPRTIAVEKSRPKGKSSLKMVDDFSLAD